MRWNRPFSSRASTLLGCLACVALISMIAACGPVGQEDVNRRQSLEPSAEPAPVTPREDLDRGDLPVAVNSTYVSVYSHIYHRAGTVE